VLGGVAFHGRKWRCGQRQDPRKPKPSLLTKKAIPSFRFDIQFPQI
jgi:hypothetical protein